MAWTQLVLCRPGRCFGPLAQKQQLTVQSSLTATMVETTVNHLMPATGVLDPLPFFTNDLDHLMTPLAAAGGV